MRVYLQSRGCRLNRSEIETMARRLAAAGHTVVSAPAQAEICILNTCAVTVQAERKSRRCARALARANPEARLALVGCYATLSPELCADLPGVAWVIPNDEKERTVEMVGEAFPLSPSHSGGAQEGCRETLGTRAFVKVQDGCDNRCTYCIIRSLRGPARSRPVAEIVAEVQMRVEAGYREIVLTGVNLGGYGRNQGLSGGLYILVEALLQGTDVARLRLSSLEPWELDADFFRLWENPRLCRQLHLPLQAGCDETLRRMGRPITTAAFASLVKSARDVIPDLAVTSDVIVGFPGEDEAAFRTSYDFIAEMRFARLHVFPYSPRPGTAAARLPGRVPHEVRQARACEIRALGRDLALRFRRRFTERVMMVLWERRRRDGRWAGLTDNYIRVVTWAEENLHNRLTPTRLLGIQDGCLIGEVSR